MPALSTVVSDATPIEPAEYGLLSSATHVTELSDHGINGIDYETSECASTVHLEAICNSSTQVSVVADSDGSLYRKYFPFDIVTEYSCSTMGTSPEEVENLVKEHAEACAQKALEFEFWTGSLAKAVAESDDWDSGTDGAYPNRYLASSAATDVTPTPGTGVRVKHAIALLEKALADCGCGSKGTIHLTREVASVLNRNPKEGLLSTNLGTNIIAGVGYEGTGPDGTDPGGTEVWAYATGPVTVRLGDVVVTPGEKSQAINIQDNTTKYYAQQPAAVTWDSCCHAAVLVDLSLDYA